MVRPFHGILLVAAALALALAASLGLPSCGVMSSGDCTDKASCAPPDATDEDAGDDALTGPGDDSSQADAGDEDDGALDECIPQMSKETNCNDGIDNDCNGQTDCEDQNCKGQNYACAGSPPQGWLGPVALWEGPIDAGGPPDCPSGYDHPTDGYGSLIAPSPQCACACAPPADLVCPDPKGTFYKDMMCGDASTCVQSLPIQTTCTPIPGGGLCGNVFTFSVDTGRPTGGKCTVRVTSPPPAPPAWSSLARLCSVTVRDISRGCSAANECVLTPGNQFETGTCIYRIIQNGDRTPACPAGFGATPKVFYASSTPVDTRSCPCECGPPTGACVGTIKIFDGPNCGGTPLMPLYTVGMGCQPESFSGGPPPSYAMGAYSVADAGCAPVVGMPAEEGGVTGSGPATIVCCP